MKILFEMILQISDVKCANIKETMDLITDLGYDSIRFIQLLSEIEDAFQIEFNIDDIDLQKLRSLMFLAQLVKSKIEDNQND